MNRTDCCFIADTYAPFAHECYTENKHDISRVVHSAKRYRAELEAFIEARSMACVCRNHTAMHHEVG